MSEWHYAVGLGEGYETRHEAAGAAAIEGRESYVEDRYPTVWPYRVCDCDDPEETVDIHDKAKPVCLSCEAPVVG